LRALRAGALGYVAKGEAITSVLLALRKVAKGEIYVSPRFSGRLVFQVAHSADGKIDSPLNRLSNRELEVVEFGRGLATKDVAFELHLSPKTIETYRAHQRKIGFQRCG
jgi:DNA-binding NarL/FixJ family response regulator